MSVWRHSQGLRSNLDEARCVEVAIERQRLTDAPPAHDGEAGGIDKRVLSLRPRPEPAPSFCLGSLIDVDDLRVRKRHQPVDEPRRGSVARSSTKKCPGFAHDMVGCDDSSYPPRRKLPGLRVPAVMPLLKSKPEAGVGKPHFRGPYKTSSISSTGSSSSQPLIASQGSTTFTS